MFDLKEWFQKFFNEEKIIEDIENNFNRELKLFQLLILFLSLIDLIYFFISLNIFIKMDLYNFFRTYKLYGLYIKHPWQIVPGFVIIFWRSFLIFLFLLIILILFITFYFELYRHKKTIIYLKNKK